MAKQSLHQSLQQKLSPQQIQLMKLIELSTLEIEQKVKDELEGNPALDDENLSMDDFDKHEDDVVSMDDSQKDQDFDIDQYLSDDEIPEYKLYANNYSKDDDTDSKIPIVGGNSHLDILRDQLAEFKLSPNMKIM